MRLPGPPVLSSGMAEMKVWPCWVCRGVARQGGRERGGIGVGLVEVEAPGGVAGFVGGEGDAAWFAAHRLDELGDALAEGIYESGLGVQDRDHRARARAGG